MQAALFSRRPRVGGLTVVTGGGENRLFMLDTMCATWVGPLAVAVLLQVLAPPDGGKPGGSADGRLEGTITCPVVLPCPPCNLAGPICPGPHDPRGSDVLNLGSLTHLLAVRTIRYPSAFLARTIQ